MADTIKSRFKSLWYALLTTAVIVELIGVFSKSQGDTLSEIVWAKLRPSLFGRLLILPLLSWLIYHFGFAPAHSLGTTDLLPVGLGVLLAFVARKRG